MTAAPTPLPVLPWHRWLWFVAAVMAYLLVASGGLVCVTDASMGCPDWPTCHGRLVPPWRMNSILEWTHRVATPLTLPVIITAAVVGWGRYRGSPWIFRATLASIVCILIVVVFGAVAVLWHLPRGWAAADLGTALLALAWMVTAAVAMSAQHADPSRPVRLSFRTPFVRLAAATLAAVFAVIVAGVLVSRPGSVVRCLGWPGFDGLWGPADVFDWLHIARVGLAVFASLLVVATVVQAWRLPDPPPGVRKIAAVIGVLLPVATVIALLVPAPDEGIFVPLGNLVATQALWAFLVALVVRAGVVPAPR